MRKLIRCLLLFVVAAVTQQAAAGGIVHVANGDCAGLAAAANSLPGSEPALIVLARGGTYASCSFVVKGNIVIDGAGATLMPPSSATPSVTAPTAIGIAAGAALVLRNLQIGDAAGTPAGTAAPKSGPGPKFCCIIDEPWISNGGTLTLDSDSINGAYQGGAPEVVSTSLVDNGGSLIVRNTTFFNNVVTGDAVIVNYGNADISNSTLVTGPAYDATTLIDAQAGTVTLSNNILFNNGAYPGPACIVNGGTIASNGGNVFGDSSCGAANHNDRIASDPQALDFGLHGGVIGTLALDTTSPALNAGLAANCAATDARGLSRSTQSCDAGALEVGAGSGRLSASGMSGLYYNAANNGHYVTVQRLYGDNALVIWNTFDEHGVPAWLYGVGTVNNGTIHVAQVARNVGGTLHAGGGVSGATPTLWGSFDFTLGDCFSANLSYNSPDAAFGSGSTALQRLAFVDGLDCQR
jgi:hypothetical protein